MILKKEKKWKLTEKTKQQIREGQNIKSNREKRREEHKNRRATRERGKKENKTAEEKNAK